jgi:DNA-binding HxlR family transcriptional regulator
MRRKTFARMNCSIARALEIVDEWWTMLILREAFLGSRRFHEFQGNGQVRWVLEKPERDFLAAALTAGA